MADGEESSGTNWKWIIGIIVLLIIIFAIMYAVFSFYKAKSKVAMKVAGVSKK